MTNPAKGISSAAYTAATTATSIIIRVSRHIVSSSFISGYRSQETLKTSYQRNGPMSCQTLNEISLKAVRPLLDKSFQRLLVNCGHGFTQSLYSTRPDSYYILYYNYQKYRLTTVVLKSTFTFRTFLSKNRVFPTRPW